MDTPEIVQKKRVALMDAVKADYEDVFSSVKGQKVLRDIMLSGVMERSAFSTDTLLMAANCAKQDFARHIAEMAKPTEKVEKPRRAKK
jgi:hypothetical protein